MADDHSEFDAGNATLQMSHQIAAYAKALGRSEGGDAASATMGAALNILAERHGKDGWVPVAQRWLKTIIAAADTPTEYN